VTAEDDRAESERVVRARRVDSPAAFSGAESEDEESAQTLVNLRAVDVEIIEEDDDLPADDGEDL